MKYLALIALMFPAFASAQDTIYLNSAMKPSDKASAAFYRVVNKNAPLITVKEYTIAGKLQQLTEYLVLNPEIKNGKSISFYPNGGVKEMGFYKHNNKDSVWTLYDQNNNISIQYLYSQGGKVVKVLQAAKENQK